MAGMKRLILYCFIFSAAWGAAAQELQFSQPVKLGQEVNSDDEELAPMLSPDGQTLYFTRAFHSKNTGGKYAGTDIWISRKDANGNWTPAVNAGKPWNNKRSNAVIGISADGSTVYLSNAYNNRSGISFSKLVAGKWTEPEFIPVPGINRDDFVSVYVHPSTDVMLVSMKGKGSYGEEDLYVSVKDSLGNWNQPRNLGPSINTSGFEHSPFLSADKKRLYFSSNGHPGLGSADIFYSDRLYDSWETWTAPKNIGEKINSKGFDGYFYCDNDSLAIFSSLSSNNFSELFTVQVQRVRRRNIEDNFTFLSERELASLFKQKVEFELNFESGSSVLNISARNQLAKIARALEDVIEVKVHLVAKRFVDSGDLELSKLRLFNILEYLKQLGTDGTRVTFGSEIETSMESRSLNTVLVRFYK